eukprot:jgi/Chrzof1/10734/Cz05g10140.t1
MLIGRQLVKPQIALARLEQEVEDSPNPTDILKANNTPSEGWLTPLAVNGLLYRHGTEMVSLRTAVELQRTGPLTQAELLAKLPPDCNGFILNFTTPAGVAYTPVEIRPLFSQTCTARIQKFPDGSGSPQMFPDVSRCFQMCPEVSRGPESHRGPTLKHRPQHRAEDTESLERLRQQISIRLWAHAHTHNRCAAQKFVVFGHKCCVQFVSKVTMTELEKLGIPRLNDHNYVFWHIKMRAYLVARGYSAAITNAEDANSDKALASITLAVEDHFLPTVYKAASAKAAWDALEALFQQRSVANQLNLTQELNNLTLQPGETITQLLARARIIWEQLKAAGIDKSEQEVALSVLSGLPADFNTLVTVLQNQSGPLTLGGIQKAVLTEQQRANKVGASTSTAASTKAFYTQNGPNHGRLGDSGTRTSNFNQGNSNTKQQEQRKCYYCGKKGHLKRDCRKKKADEQRGPSTKASTTMAWTAACNTSISLSSGTWVLDSGASRHVCKERSLMQNMQQLNQPVYITYGNGSTGVAQTMGEVVLNDRIRLRNVLFDPTAVGNLLSIRTAAACGAQFNFAASCCTIRVNGRLVAIAQQHDGHYCLHSEHTESATALAAQTPQLWHRRFGHLSYQNMAKVPNLVLGRPSPN